MFQSGETERFFRRILWFTFFATVTFCIARKTADDFSFYPLQFSPPAALVHFSFAAVFFSLTLFMANRLAWIEPYAPRWSVVRLALGFLTAASIYAIFFHFQSLKKMILVYKKEWILGSAVAILFLNTYPLMQRFWRPLAASIAGTVTWLLRLTDPTASFSSATMDLDTRYFSVSIGAPCSGLEGIGLFLILFVGLVVLDWKVVSKSRAAVLCLIGIAVMYLANWVRIYLIMIVGFLVSRKFGPLTAQVIVIEQFHTHLGWIFYSAVLFIFFKISYPFLIARNRPKPLPQIKNS